MTQTLRLNNGNEIPSIGIGTWKADRESVQEAVEYAVLEVGYRHIDCASIYGNQKEIGKAFRNIFKKIPREEVFITSKLWSNKHGTATENALKNTLSDLQIDYLDLYLIHWAIAFPVGEELEPLDENGIIQSANIPIQETWKEMENLVKKKLVKSIGVANFTTSSLVDLLSYAKIKPVTNQIELHPYNSQAELIDFMTYNDLVATAYSPLGTPGGIKDEDPILMQDDAVKKIAKKHKATEAQILLAWGMQRGTSVIPKSTNKKRISENFASTEISLNEDDIEVLDSLNANYRFVDPNGWWGIPYFS